jgi:hypothetical protein
MNRRFGLLFAAALALLGTPSPSSAATDLILNGSFEEPNQYGGWNVYGSIPGWTTISGPGIEMGYVGLYGLTEADGNQVVELDSYGNSGMRQTVATTPGQQYTLTFRTGMRGWPETNQIDVYWNGALLDSISPNWTEMRVHTYTVTATDTSTDLDFYGGGINDSYGSMLDDVTLVVPDTTAPTLSGVSVDKPTLWSPNHKMVDVTVFYDVSDNEDPAPAVTLTVTSSEPDNGLGDGDTAGDIQIVDGHHVRLRAERSGKGSGRVYTITITAKDASGNTSTQTVTVTVPKSQK